MSTAPSPTTGQHPGTHVRTGHGRATVSRAGHAVAVVINLAVLYLVNVWPGWDAVPFLTESTTQVIGIVNASLWVSVVAEATYVVTTSRWWRALGDAVTTGVGLAAVIRIWQVFPFDLSSGWELAFRVVLVVAIVGSLIGIVAAISRFVTSLTGPGEST